MRRTLLPALVMLAVTVGLAAVAIAPPKSPRAGQTASPPLDAWVQAIVDGRARLRKALDGKPAPVTTEVMRGGMQPVEMAIDLTGQTDLYLTVESAPTYDYGQSTWGEPVLIAADGSTTRLTDLKPTDSRVGWGTLLVDKNVAGAPLRLGGKPMAFGYWAHADSLLHFRLHKPYRAFHAWAGIDDGAGTNVHVRFTVSTVPPDAMADPTLTAAADRAMPGLAPLSRRLLVSDLDAPALRAEAEKALAEHERATLARRLAFVNKRTLRLSLDELAALAPGRYPDLQDLRAKLAALPEKPGDLAAKVTAGDADALRQARAMVALQRDILLRDPALDFDHVLAVRRSPNNMGLPANFNSNADLPRHGYDNQVVRLSIHGREPVETVLRLAGDRFIGDLCLRFSADRLLYSSTDDHDRWHVFEARLDGSAPRQVTPDMGADVDNYDACYLPGGGILFTSTAGMVAVPCVAGASPVANVFRLSPNGTVSQLCFDQEHNWTPRVMADGSVLYQRWEYTDTPHSNTRLLFTMNPDGTNQREFYGSNSYWPSAFFYAQPVPGKPTQVLGISTGHHGVARVGELVLLDADKGRSEGSGVVRNLSGVGRPVQARIYDHMDAFWPIFVHPHPINDRVYLVSCQPAPNEPWGIYLIDKHDNLMEIASEPGCALLEPNALLRRPAPPAIPDRIDPNRRDATVLLQDIYQGPGLKGIPRGTVKSLRLFSYTFGYRGVGGLYGAIGMDGPWDIHRVLGTVPVEADGSAVFRVPANVPLAIQPLDEKGQALALMRSWLTARPGETLSCVGCHEGQGRAPSGAAARLAARAPADIRPWRPQVAGFSFEREVQPVLDRHCVGCHQPRKASPDLRGGIRLNDWSSQFAGNGGGNAGRFSTAYANLFPFVRNNGIEGDYHVLAPMEFHCSSTELGKMLRKGHHGVKLDADSWDRLVTWHDMNRPYHGSWSSIVGPGIVQSEERRRELRLKYANVDENHEAPAPDRWPAAAVPSPPPAPAPSEGAPPAVPIVPDWPFDAAAAKAMQGDGGEMALDLGGGQRIVLVRVPAGEFAMGSTSGHDDERPISRVRIGKAFWVARFEVTNGQYRAFDATHDSRVADALAYQFGQRPWSLNEPDQPVCRVSWREAMAFCEWLSRKTGKRVTLPTEAQWEWACRAGSAEAFSFGPMDADYTPFANLGDKSLSLFAADTSDNDYHSIRTMRNPNRYDDWIPKDAAHNDGHQLAAKPGSYRANAWGLFDMHGNVAEWTRSLYRPYPYDDADGRNDVRAGGERAVRGGSWWVRPFECTSSYRVPYADYQPVMDTGFRVIVEE